MDKEEIRNRIMGAGAVAVGFAAVGKVPESVTDEYWRWISSGNHAGMGYMERHGDLRRDPREMVPGARSVIVAAFSYKPAEEGRRPSHLPMISCYAWGDDYHDVMRRRLSEACKDMPQLEGSRICIDSAPVHERYWARKAGIGYVADNGMLNVPGYGNMVFLAEIFTQLEIEPDASLPLAEGCLHCEACRRVCPAGAMGKEGKIDGRKCLSYLTIEHRGEWDTEEMRAAMATREGGNTLYGCDRCMEICPLNKDVPATEIEEFRIRDIVKHIDAETVKQMSPEEFNRLFKGSAIKRAKHAGLLRNASNS